MNLFLMKRSSLSLFVSVIQILFLTFYFLLNILNVGEMGTGLLLLAGFFALSGTFLVLEFLQGNVVVRGYFFVFLFFVGWLAFRVVVDLDDFEYLKQITIATTGGVLLFFLIGTFVRRALDEIIFSKNSVLLKFLIFLFLLENFLVFLAFKDRLLSGGGIFLIEGVNDGYQRPGNFMIMLFIMHSLIYFSIAAQENRKNIIGVIFWMVTYSLSMMLSLINSQMMGSNAATANVMAIYLMTIVGAFLAFNKEVREKYFCGRIILPFSKLVFMNIAKYTLVIIFTVMAALTFAIQFTDLNLGQTRIFGFGAGENTSLNSRLEILRETGFDQMGFSPIFGNVDVARLATGDAGRTLHNFLLNVIAELGLIGLLIVAILFILVIINLLNYMRVSAGNETGFIRGSIGFWLFVIFIFLFLYANIAVGKEWPVMWFFVGFTASVFYRRLKK